MAKLIKGNSVQNIITDGDVIVTSPSKIGKTLDEVLVEQQSDIDKLKSNVKYIYAYGGVGGSGSGGSGSTDKPITVFITLNGSAVTGGDTIILDGRGKYKLYVKVNNAGGKKLYMGYGINTDITDKMVSIPLDGDNKYKREFDEDFNENGVLNIRIDDDEGNIIAYYAQKYIVDSDMFNVTLNYVDSDGEDRISSEPYECHVIDPNRLNRHFKIDYTIFLTDYTDVKVSFKIDGVDEINYEESGTSIIIPLEGILIGGDSDSPGETILQNKYMGSYTLTATLSYIINGAEIVRTRNLLFTIVPSGLYINVKTHGDILYDSIYSLMADMEHGENRIPSKYITRGSSLMLFCKVFEGDIIGDKIKYPTTFKPFDSVTDSDNNIMYDECGNIIWSEINVSINEELTEQEESKKGVSITFSKSGIKKIVISTTQRKGNDAGTVKTFEKYVYVKDFESECPWYNSKIHGVFFDSYFRANQGDKTYGGKFPNLSSGEGVLGSTISSKPIELTDPSWYTDISGNICTVLSFGIQVSNINSEDAKIVEIYQNGLNIPKFTLRTTRLFTDVNSSINKIAIPTEILDKDKNKQYHLIQIIRNYNGSEFEDSLYIDGLLESVDRNVSYSPLVISKIILNNINIYYNLINLQYVESVHTTDNGEKIKFNSDGYAYQYWLSYKEKYVNSDSETNRVTDEEKFISENMHRIFFDGTNVEVDETIITNIAFRSKLPTVVFSYACGSNEDVTSFMEMMWQGRPNGDDTFGSRKINLYWLPAGASGSFSEYLVDTPKGFTTYKNELIKGEWEIDLQGTSTMRNRIKNYSLRIATNSEKEKILFSPNFNIKDNKTFLPDVEWTIKADIADSAHANNTSIGKFVNEVCTKFDTNIPGATPEAKSFVKNTLEGIPVLLYFMCTDDSGNKKIYYFGIYNFNLGRTSYYNLGYTGGIVDGVNVSDYMRVFNNLTNMTTDKADITKCAKGESFTFAVGEVSLSKNLVIGEIQDNFPEFDFHQYHDSVLFKSSEKANTAAMFGADSKITAVDKTLAKGALQSLVRGVAKAGKYCFIRSGRTEDFITSKQGNSCVNRYDEGKIPDPIYQMRYVNDKLVWDDKENDDCKYVNENDLRELITTFANEDGTINKPLLNYTSASEYYTICMAFGMVDSVLKNMNLKSFSGYTDPYFHCSFYDMDCALEEDNSGEETVSYMAATDYWYSPVNPTTKQVDPVEKKNDYWDRVNGGQGFDFTSSYLLAVVKYAKPIFSSLVNQDAEGLTLENYPQRFWAILRSKDGALKNANHFIDTYFKSGITTTFEYLSSLNYRVKYLYKGETLDTNDNVVVQPLANAAAFNGSRRVKVKNWLTKRLRFMDFMMNVNGLNTLISDNDTITVPIPGDEYMTNLMNNPDITILHSAFEGGNLNQALNNYTGEVKIYAPKNTPCIFKTAGGASTPYLLPGGIDTPNVLYLSVYASQTANFYGSGLFTSVDKVETMFTKYRSIISDNIEKITYGGVPVNVWGDGFIINAKSATEISLNIPNMGGELTIDESCISLSKINIANSGFYGEFDKFPNLQEINISSVLANTETIYIGGSDFLKGEKIIISGSDEDHKTELQRLEITGVSGNFDCVNTAIQYISIENSADRDKEGFDSSMLSEFSIVGDSTLTSLTLFGFRKVSITSCNSLSELIIDDALEELYIDLAKISKEDNSSALKKISNGTSVKDGVFDFTGYPNLKRVTIKNCENLVHIKLPEKDIETDGISDNENLEWIDTGKWPAFSDTKDYKASIEIDGQYVDVVFKRYSKSPKLILCSSGAFRNCPKYAMLRSDWDKGETYINNPYNIAYTNIMVHENCTSLSETFYLNTSKSGDKFNMDTAIRFIEKCVPDNVKENITSLSGCFRGRTGVVYSIAEAAAEKPYENIPDYGELNNHPILSKYRSLKNISSMYYGTGVTFVSKNLLDLPYDQNVPGNELSWDSFIQGMTKLDISSDALYNISYRLSSYSYVTFTIHQYNANTSSYEPVGKGNNMFNVCDFFYPFDDGKKIYTEENGCEFSDDLVPYESINTITSLNFGDQKLDFRGMFKLFPNVQSISLFLYGCNLSKYNLDGLLQPCVNITSISQSFCDINVETSTQVIDLFKFFNWEHNTENVTRLFEGSEKNYLINGFEVRKTISYDKFEYVLERISKYKLTRLTNLFSYCTITGYEEYHNSPEHELGIRFKEPLNNITNISNLFNGCTSDYKPFANVADGDKGVYKGGVLKIGRAFFESLPNVVTVYRTFKDTYLSSPLTYDFFCKRSKSYIATPVYLSENGGNEATLYEYTYRQDLITLDECFCNTKFVNCKNWFDHNENVKLDRNHIELNGEIYDENGIEYYIHDEMYDSFIKYTLDNNVIDDCFDNYTDFVSQNAISYKTNGEVIFYNHDITQDLKYYGNVKGGSRPFDPNNINDTIQETYCCLPPDLLYGCISSATVNNMFANSNIIGVIPRNFTKNIRDNKNNSMSNLFMNVNIMPNLEYYYDEKGSLNDLILDKVELPSDIDGTPEEYTVVFRDENGKLQRRKPIDGDRNLGQFVYVPANYTNSGSLVSMFNFRYNLPKHWEMPDKPSDHVGYYKTTRDFDNAIAKGEINPKYHSQYYFMTNKSVDWKVLYDARTMFINYGQDVDFGNMYKMGQMRFLYDNDIDLSVNKVNCWVKNDSRVISALAWTNNIIERFYIDLNLCGSKNNETNMLENKGCPIIVKNKGVLLDNFVTDILTIFLNGRIFGEDFDIGDLSTSNHKAGSSSFIINYYSYGKNIILPKFNVSLSDREFEFMPIDKENVYYDFMLDGETLSIKNYNDYLVRGRRGDSSGNNADLFEDNYNKYTFK